MGVPPSAEAGGEPHGIDRLLRRKQAATAAALNQSFVTRLLLALVALDLELPGVVLNELLDVVRHREQPEPLLLIERHGVAPQSINGDATTLRHLEKGALAGPCAELLVLPLKSFQLRTHIICHGASSSGERSIVCPPVAPPA